METKPYLFRTVFGLAFIGIALASYLYWAHATFAAQEIKRRTGAATVTVLEEFHHENEWYAKVEIDPQTGSRLLKDERWERGFTKNAALASKLTTPSLLNCSDCFYRIVQAPHDAQFHPYNCTLYVLSADLKRLQLFEMFGS